MLSRLSNNVLQVRHHFYFQRGHRFGNMVGQFPIWALLAPEDGTFTYALPHESGRVGFGSVLLCPPHTVLHRHIEGFLTYHIMLFSTADDAANLLPQGSITIRDTARLSSTFHHLRDLAGRFSPFVSAAQAHLLLDILYLIDKEKVDATASAQEMSTSDHTLMKARWQIEHSAFRSDFSLRQVAHDVHLTPVQLTRRFRSAFGQTPIAFLTSLRLANAQTLLIETDLPLREIAEQCGYNSEHYFSRIFFQHIRVRPGEFRTSRRF